VANQRPIRRGKIPFFRRKRRPTRWQAYTQEATNPTGEIASLLLPLASNDLLGPILVLIDGAQDVEPWADDQEVTLDRIVGSLCTQFTEVYTAVPTVVEQAHRVFARYGLLVAEELEPTTPPQINLWDSDALEQYEWMWLADVVPEESTSSIELDDTTTVVRSNLTRTPLDVRVRRKIGPSDQLLLYGSAGRMEAASAGDQQFFARVVPCLRTILMSR